MSWDIKFTTDAIVKPIFHVEVLFPIRNKRTTVLYLGLVNSMIGANKKMIPLTHEFGEGGFRNDSKFLKDYKLPSEATISRENGGIFTHAFVCGNFGNATSQVTYQDVLEASLREDYGYVFPNTVAELSVKLPELQTLLQNKELECTWSMWVHKSRNLYCYGPNGEYLKVV